MATRFKKRRLRRARQAPIFLILKGFNLRKIKLASPNGAHVFPKFRQRENWTVPVPVDARCACLYQASTFSKTMHRELAAASIPIQARIASDWTRVARATRQIPRENGAAKSASALPFRQPI
jgi:hypothetical protein